MATRAATMDYLLDQMSGAGQVTAKKMFGEYGVYLDGKIIALVCDDLLYVKPTKAGLALIGDDATMGAPYPNAKPHLLIEGDRCEDRDFLSDLLRATARDLPAPKEKKAKPEKKTAKRK